jgi:hypothetical protein
MSPLMPRRRSRRRSVSRRLVLLVVAALVIALLVGGLTQVSRQSHLYDANLNRSLAAQGAVVADESSATSLGVSALMADMQNEDRRTLQAQLDSVAQQTADQSTRADRAAGTPPAGSVSAEFASVFADRARAVGQVRAAIDGLLGMHPLPVAGVPGNGGTGASTPTLLTSTEATDRIAAAGSLLAQSDQVYNAARHRLATSVGHAKLPKSEWVTDPQVWQVGAVATAVDQVAASASLAATHELVLRTVRISPQALPTANGTAAGTSVLTPTSAVSVTVVLSNLGSVDEPRASVRCSLAPQVPGSPVTQTREVAVTAGGSVTLPAVSFAVKPGHNYQLTVSVDLPLAQTSVVGTTLTQVLQIAPGT